MTAAERHAIKVLVDRAKRASLAGQAIHSARVHRGSEHVGHNIPSTLHARPVRVPGSEGGLHDESWDDAKAFVDGIGLADFGASFRGLGSGLPSQRSSRRRAA